MSLDQTFIYCQPHEMQCNQMQNRNYPQFSESVVDFLTKAEQVATDVLGAPATNPRVVQQPSSVTHIGKIQFGNTYSGFNWNVGNTTTIVAAPGRRGYIEERDRKKKEDNTALRIFAGLVGSIIVGVAAYKIPQWWNNAAYAKEESRQIRDFRTSFVPGYFQINSRHPHATAIEKIAIREQEIFSHIRRHENTKIALMVSGVAGAAFLLLGALTAPELITFGAIALAVTAVASIAIWSSEKSDRIFQEKAKEIRTQLDKLSQDPRRFREYQPIVVQPGGYGTDIIGPSPMPMEPVYTPPSSLVASAPPVDE